MQSKRRTRQAYLFMLPALAFVVAIYLLPFVCTIAFSLTDWTGLGFRMNWIGLRNYANAALDRNFLAVMGNTFVFFLELVVVQFLVSLALAAIVDGQYKGAGFFRSVFFLPTVVCTIAVGFIWNIMYDPISGPIKSLLEALGLRSLAGVMWLSNPATAIHAVSLVSIWQWTGWSMVIYLAGMQGISRDLYEAAAIDGAGPLRKFFRITLPLLAPSITINLVNSTIGALKMFDLPFALTKGGPGYATETLSMLMYNYSFSLNKMGYGSAIAMILFAIVLVISGVQTGALRRNEDRIL
jgi:raffinose/stachyose/melibiose transport system permease protein